jgi:uncharacterized protein YbjQ (UPF0145 family)
MSPVVATTCPKCGFQHTAPTEVCAKCGVVFARFAPEKVRISAGQVVVSTTTLSEPFTTLGPVHAVTTDNHGVLTAAAKKLGIEMEAIGAFEFLSAMQPGEARVKLEAIPVAFTVCVEQLKREAAKIGGDAVVGMRMNYDLDRTGSGIQAFTMQLFGTAVRRRPPS